MKKNNEMIENLPIFIFTKNKDKKISNKKHGKDYLDSLIWTLSIF